MIRFAEVFQYLFGHNQIKVTFFFLNRHYTPSSDIFVWLQCREQVDVLWVESKSRKNDLRC